LEASNVVVRQDLHDSEAEFANGQSLANNQVLVGIRHSGLEAEALVTLAKWSLQVIIW
jgi:hypothetical protein